MKSEERRLVEKVLMFRTAVSREFERPVREGMKDSASTNEQIQLREIHASDQGTALRIA